jgi:tetratricopeptide (TPR) repeat protein
LILFFATIEYFASSRGAWLGAVAGIGLITLLLNLKKFTLRVPFRKRLQTLINTKTVVSIFALLAIGGMIGIVFLRQVATTPGHGSGGSGRFQIWANAFNVFRASPIRGNGPSSMRVLYAVEAAIPPGFSAGHAHNALLQIIGEMGILGLGLVGWLGWMIIRTFTRAWQNVPDSVHPRLAGYAGAFAALTVHHMFDYAFELLPYTVGVLLLLSLLIRLAPDTERIEIKKGLWVPLLAGILVLFGLGSFFTLGGSTEFQKGIDAARNAEWGSARDDICAAFEINPNISHYAFQCGLIQAQYAHITKNPEPLESAISAYTAGLSADPYWPVHWANLGALEWETGDRDNAVDHMLRAMESAPNNATLALNLGWMQEQLGNENEAKEHYLLALSLNSLLEESLFFGQTDLRVQALLEFVPIIDPQSSNSLAWAGWRALNDGDLEEAEDYLEAARELDFNNANAIAWLASLNMHRGAQDQSYEEIQIALFLNKDSPIVRTEASRIARALGDQGEAMNHLYRVYELLRDGNQSFEFAAVFYMRPLLPFDLAPQLIDPKLGDFSVDEFAKLAEYLNASGDAENSRSILRWIEDEREN